MVAPRRPRPARPAAPITQPTANPDRGEHEITLDEVTYRLRPSHAAIRASEKKTGKTLLELMRAGDVGGISLEHLGMIGAELIRAGAEPGDDLTANVNAERISALMYEEGLAHVTARITLCLLDAATGGRTASGEAKAATA